MGSVPITVKYQNEKHIKRGMTWQKSCSEEPKSSTTARYRVVAYSVEPDEHYTEGVKYSFQYCDQEDENALRYDNSRHSTDIPKHHRHDGGDEEIEPVEYSGDIAAHLELFHTEVHRLRKEGA